MENEKEREVRKDSYIKWYEDMRSSNLFRGSNKIGKNLSYCAYMNSWNHSRRALLKEIIAEFETEGFSMESIYRKIDNVNEEIINHEKI